MFLPDFILEKKDQILKIANKYGATNLKIFGSQVRGDARPDSDVDIVVDITKHMSYYMYFDFESELEELLGRKVDLCTYRSLHPIAYRQMEKEAIPLEP